MADINLKRFVDINIVNNVVSSVNSIRDVVVLITDEGSAGEDKIYSSLQEYLDDDLELDNTQDYMTIFFNNNGNKVRLIQGITSSSLAATISNLPNEQIVVAYTGSYATIKGIASERSTDSSVYGINQKILLGRTTSTDNASIKNFAVKYSSVNGAEMTIAAYLSNINFYGIDTIHDYAFTKENITPTTSDDTVLGNVLTSNMNVDMELANSVRNLGGNLKDGSDLMNQFTLIVLHQTVTARLINLLTEKIKGNQGISAIYTTIAAELNKYASNGYLSTDKVWSKGTKTVTYDNITYTIIENDTPLSLGYHITILPLSSLTDEDKLQRKTPPIYIILADSYGIRQITISGEVI